MLPVGRCGALLPGSDALGRLRGELGDVQVAAWDHRDAKRGGHYDRGVRWGGCQAQAHAKLRPFSPDAIDADAVPVRCDATECHDQEHLRGEVDGDIRERNPAQGAGIADGEFHGSRFMAMRALDLPQDGQGLAVRRHETHVFVKFTAARSREEKRPNQQTRGNASPRHSLSH